ncbi:uncharacterized protein LOC115598812 isoform X2 [Calypte anna]|uniref:uncharacterized protein LOC115598812 isoform X2 n=1 Tax=Calypte anna TaxID=9244 RepID=UPI0011C36E62|nr:uncharacterized protein LOC115598812 isoform X2 [Calypte anna]
MTFFSHRSERRLLQPRVRIIASGTPLAMTSCDVIPRCFRSHGGAAGFWLAPYGAAGGHSTEPQSGGWAPPLATSSRLPPLRRGEGRNRRGRFDLGGVSAVCTERLLVSQRTPCSSGQNVETLAARPVWFFPGFRSLQRWMGAGAALLQMLLERIVRKGATRLPMALGLSESEGLRRNRESVREIPKESRSRICVVKRDPDFFCGRTPPGWDRNHNKCFKVSVLSEK